MCGSDILPLLFCQKLHHTVPSQVDKWQSVDNHYKIMNSFNLLLEPQVQESPTLHTNEIILEKISWN